MRGIRPLFLAAILAGLGGAHRAGGAYVIETPELVIFLEYSASGSDLFGSMTTFDPSPYAPGGGTSRTVDFTGSINGDSLTLAFGADPRSCGSDWSPHW
ncbi:MAG: hypothetical protein M5T61_16925 [Acidimicrobiia bacterium]|nr:hypothetical protein [Acidimicrobiia bacterium]